MTELEKRERERVGQVMMFAPHPVFVFGSNERGIHGAGAAKVAMVYGAVRGQAFGLSGRSFGIPTKRDPWKRLALDEIRAYVERFKAFARESPSLTFAVTRVGCGYAGYTDADIAPMFADAPDNCDLPTGWPRSPRTTP